MGSRIKSAAQANRFVETLPRASANGASTSVYRRSFVYYQNQSPINAAITNFPLLVQNGAVIDSTSEQNGSQLLKGAGDA